jgi:hypothetical protein
MKKFILILITILASTAHAGCLRVVAPTDRIIQTDLLKQIKSTGQPKVDSSTSAESWSVDKK